MATPKYSKPIKYDELSSLLENKLKDTVLIDVRTAEQFSQGHIKGAHNLEFADFPEALKLSSSAFKEKHGFELPTAKNSAFQVILYCGGGTRCNKSAVLAEDAGYTENVRIYSGGYREYKQKTQPE
ncbi:hypothetical protein BB561_000855 [Smittium simulii]|uniref:Rhodanese domain-containing protein n=1 Tax=Smittium simulii TaxID=133385 RepID=A0A2T9YX73_9FUNG|nr:hypothetical protein BB561_000855 [Smittium simulii]